MDTYSIFIINDTEIGSMAEQAKELFITNEL